MYYKDDKEFVFFLDNKELFRDTIIAVAYSKTTNGHCIMHKHGPLSAVNKWFLNAKRLWDLVDMSEELNIIINRNWNIDELNNIINISGYIEIYIEKQPPFYCIN